MATAFPFLEFVVGTTYIITLVYGGYLTLYGEITLGQFIAFNQYIGMLVWPMIAFGDMITSVAQARAAIGRIRHIYDEVPDIQDAEDCVAVSEIKGDIRFEDVTFAYTKDGQKWLAYTTLMQKAQYNGLQVIYLDQYMFSGGFKTMKLK